MNEFTLYTFSGDALFNIVPDESSTHEWSLMSENRLSLTFELEQCVNLSPGCYVDFDGVRYYLLEEYKPQMVDTTAWEYNVNLLDAASWMSVTLALNLLDGQNAPIFNYTAPAREHAQIIVDNLNRRMGTTAWKVGRIISTANITIEYRGKYCSEVLQEIVDRENTEWWVDGMTLNIGRAEFGDSIELGYQNGLLGDIVCEQADNMRTYAYLYPIGSMRNIDPTKYGFERLQLPNGLTRVAMNPEQGIAELVEESAFAKIFPRYEGTVRSVRPRPAKGDDGREFTIYYIGDTLPFNPNDYEIAGLVKQITFLSGQLMGQDFEVNYDPEAQEFEIITQWPNGGEAQLPGGLLTPEVGDKYVVWNITMPDVYYTLASQEFLEAAEAYAAEAIQDVSIYKAPLDYIDVQERGLRLRPGQRVRLLSDAYFMSGYYDSRITRITRSVLTPDAPNIDVSAVRATGTISRLQATIQKTESQVAQLSGALPTVVKSGEDTSASDSSVYTSAKSEREFLNKRKGGSVVGRVDFTAVPGFPSGADFNGAIVRFDVATKSWIFPYNVCIEGGVAWNASIEGFKPQTVAQAVLVDWETIGKRDDGTLFVIGGTTGGGGGVADSVAWGNVTGKPSWLTNEKPSVSVFANDAGYITSAALGPYALASAIPTNNNQLTNGEGYITNSVSGDFSATGMVRGNYLSTGYIQISSNIDASLRTYIFGDAGNHWGQIKAFRTGGSASYGSLAGGYAAGILFAMNDTHGFIQLPEAASKAGEAVIGGGTGENIKWSAKLLHSLNYANYALPISGGTINGSLTVTTSVTSPTFVGALSGTATNATQLNGLGADYYVKSPSTRDFASFNSGLGRNAIYEYRARDGVTYAGDPVGEGYGVLMNIRDYEGYDGFQFLSTAASDWNKTDYRLLYRGKARSPSIDMANGWSEIPLMDMSGNLVVKGEVSWHSSRVLKNIVNDEPTYLSMADMLKIKPYRYTWKDGRDDKVHAGGIADEVLDVLPEVIITDSEGIHSMDYGQASFTVATSLTPHVNRHEEEIDALKRREKELEDLVTKLLNKYGGL